MPATKEQCRKWRQRLKERAVQALCGVLPHECEECGATESLEFAHVKDTGLKGASRGQDRRMKDVIRNPHAYRVLCKTCHHEFDYGGGRSEPIPD